MTLEPPRDRTQGPLEKTVCSGRITKKVKEEAALSLIVVMACARRSRVGVHSSGIKEEAGGSRSLSEHRMGTACKRTPALGA